VLHGMENFATPGGGVSVTVVAVQNQNQNQRRKVGQGRSGEVWLVETPEGRHVEKVFFGDTLSNLVHYVFTGAPNPYIWNEDAVRAGFERRRILAVLMPWWFGEALSIANAVGVGWSDQARVFTLTADYVDGTPVPLLHPYRPTDKGMPRLAHELMPALQQRLLESGFDGLVWQAGKGNPVALNNFLMTAPDGARFVFIDSESGVPALFPLNPVALFGFYLPMAARYRRPLFDDVDTARLRAYVRGHEGELAARIGGARFAGLLDRVDRLEEHQLRLNAMSRVERGIAYQCVKARITPGEADHYRRHPVRWRLRELKRLVPKAARAAGVTLPKAVASLVGRLDLTATWRNLSSFVTSQAYRTAIGEDYVRTRVEQWRGRRQLGDPEAERLLEALADLRESSRYLTDFGAHLGMKASFLALEVLVLGALSLMGVSLVIIGMLFVLDGPIYRTSYTTWRSVRAVAARNPPPWVAMMVGVLPLFGSLAFPAQMVWSAGGKQDDVARFIVYDTFTRLAANIPIWGGYDTATEHVFNRLAARLVGARR
jgi:hypothetical protein